MQRLPKLQSLQLEVQVEGLWEHDTLAPLKHLTALTCLDISAMGLHGPMHISSELATLTQLRILKLHASSGYHHFPTQALFSQMLSQLTCLTTLSLAGMLDSVPPQLANLMQLKYLTLQNFCSTAPPLSIPACLTLCSNLEHVALRGLSDESSLMEAWWGLCQSLQCLPSLASLSFTKIDLSRLPDDARTLPSRLTSLELDNCKLVHVPSAVRQLPLLENLTLIGTPIIKLDGGAYLENLRELCIHFNEWEGSTSIVLAGAERLKEMIITFKDSGRQGSWTENIL